jgi:hypothetical protein
MKEYPKRKVLAQYLRRVAVLLVLHSILVQGAKGFSDIAGAVGFIVQTVIKDSALSVGTLYAMVPVICAHSRVCTVVLILMAPHSASSPTSPIELVDILQKANGF